MKKVLVAMSGGVDSTVAAKLLLDRGYDIGGAYMRMLPTTSPDYDSAKAAADKLGIPFYVFSVQHEFRENVLDYFVNSYLSSITPNPCVVCNKKIKFGAFLSRAMDKGYDHISTGHYARVKYDSVSGRYLLLRSANREKDQSYFLYHLTQEQLSKCIFPLEDESKDNIRSIASNFGFDNAEKPDSQDICFIRNGTYASFIEKYTGIALTPGYFIDTDGNILGRHSGAARYTIGQRKGVNVAFGKPLYVVSKDCITNTVVMGEDSFLYTSSLTASDVNFIPYDRPVFPLCVTAKTRYGKKEATATIVPSDREDGHYTVMFSEPQRAIARGQSVVFYDGETVVGGGTII